MRLMSEIQAHALRNVISETPEIDDVAAAMRGAGARSIKVGVSPAAFSQKARVGPAIPAPTMRTVLAFTKIDCCFGFAKIDHENIATTA